MTLAKHHPCHEKAACQRCAVFTLLGEDQLCDPCRIEFDAWLEEGLLQCEN